MPVPGTSQRGIVPGIAFGGLLFAWGDSSTGHLGDGQTATDFSSPIAIGAQNWKQISCGGFAAGSLGNDDGHTLAIRNDGLLFSWGNNSGGGLGDGTQTSRSSPVQIGSSSWRFVSAGGGSSYGIREDWLLFAWGRNANGELGLNDTTSRSSPVQVGSSSWSFVSGGQGAALAIRADGLLFAWGANGSGQLGDGTTTQRNSPVQIGSSSWFRVSVGSGGVVSAGIRVDRLLFTWGNATSGGLANSTTTPNLSSPVQVGASSWSAVAMTVNGGMAIRVDGLLFCWGVGTSGELGDGTAVSKSSPVQVGSSLWQSIAASASRHAVDVDSRLFAWGNSSSGQLGDGAATNRSSPVQVGSSSWASVAGGYTGTFISFFTVGLKLS